MESRPYEFLLHSPLLMLLVSITSIIYWDIFTLALLSPTWENAINLWVTKFTRHCRKQGPQISMIKITITTVTMIFHQTPLTQDRTKVQKGIFSLDMAFTWFCISSKAVYTFSDRSGMYTQHSHKSLLGLLWVCLMPSYFELLPSSSESVLCSKLEWL